MLMAAMGFLWVPTWRVRVASALMLVASGGFRDVPFNGAQEEAGPEPLGGR